MLTIELKSVDQLHAILTKLDVITFLQSLLQAEAEQRYVRIPDSEDIVPSTQYQLWDWQADTLNELRALLHKEDFTNVIPNAPTSPDKISPFI